MQDSKPPRQNEHRWVLLAGCCLSFLSAAVNACFLVRLGTSVGHLTGDVSRVAVEWIASLESLPVSGANLLAATLSFVAGAATSGFCIHHPNLQTSRPYGAALAGIGSCLTFAHLLLPLHPFPAVALSAFACGMQNALATHYKGVILRTTHLTGLLTDLGSNFGMLLRGHSIPRRMLLVPLALTSSFFSGAATGALLVLQNHPHTLLYLACGYFAGALHWGAHRRLSRTHRAAASPL